jgi:hypothetical protein
MKCPCGDIFNNHCLEENLVHVRLPLSRVAGPFSIQCATILAQLPKWVVKASVA